MVEQANYLAESILIDLKVNVQEHMYDKVIEYVNRQLMLKTVVKYLSMDKTRAGKIRLQEYRARVRALKEDVPRLLPFFSPYGVRRAATSPIPSSSFAPPTPPALFTSLAAMLPEVDLSGPSSLMMHSDFAFMGGVGNGIDAGVETPTRFLQEFVNFKFTPGLITRYCSGDFNPFELSFTEKVDPDATAAPVPMLAIENAPAVTDAASIASADLESQIWDATPPFSIALSPAPPSNPGASPAFPQSVGAMPDPAFNDPMFAISPFDAAPVLAAAAASADVVVPIVPQPPAQFGLQLPIKRPRMKSISSPASAPAADPVAPDVYPPTAGVAAPRAMLPSEGSRANIDRPSYPQQYMPPQHLHDQQPLQLQQPQYAPSSQNQFQAQAPYSLPQFPLHMQGHPLQPPLERSQPFLPAPPTSVADRRSSIEKSNSISGASKTGAEDKAFAKPKSKKKATKSVKSESKPPAFTGPPIDTKTGYSDDEDMSDDNGGSGSKSPSVSGSGTPGTRKRKAPPTEEEQDDKRKRFLERNRLAASKCRTKKKQWLQDLESRSSEIGQSNRQLQQVVAQLKEEALLLKGQLLLHRNCQCNVIHQYNATSQFGPLPQLGAQHQQQQQSHHISPTHPQHPQQEQQQHHSQQHSHSQPSSHHLQQQQQHHHHQALPHPQQHSQHQQPSSQR
ncbi:hypothetical protein HKX48_004889 [Thoreauomyces humboldtii]|nr:hypothetical protein HKX48_004889 [Thoreauomyces humboldtii]